MNSSALPPVINKLVDIQFDLICLSDGELGREVLSIPERDFELSVKYIRSLIQTRLNIPLVCQIKLSLADISLDSMESDHSAFPSRIQRSGERLPITLHYYANSVPLKPIEKMVEDFDKYVSEADYRLIYIILNSLNHEHMNLQGWDSKEAMGTRIYLRDSGFLSKLLKCINIVNRHLYFIYEKFSQNQPGEQDQQQSELLGRAESISTALDAALAFIWNFGAKCMDRICLHNSGFLYETMQSIAIADMFLQSQDESFRGFGRTVFNKCIGVIQGFAELRTPAMEIGKDTNITQLLRRSVLGDNIEASTDPLNSVIQVLIFFSISSQTEISQRLCSDYTYQYLLPHFSRQRILPNFSNCSQELAYVGCLIMLNWLKTPVDSNHVPPLETFKEIITLFKNFNNNVTMKDILKFEDYYKFIWGSLDPFTSLFFIPANSLLGWLYRMRPPEIFGELYSLYSIIACFSLRLLLKREISRMQLLEENLLSHFVLASWKFYGIFDELKKSYPEIIHLPVPTLYDIAVVQLVLQGHGWGYTYLIHHPI